MIAAGGKPRSRKRAYLIYRCDVIFPVIGICPPTAGRGDEAFGDQVSNLTLRYPGTASEVTNMHVLPLSTRTMAKGAVCVNSFLQFICRKARGIFCRGAA